METNPYTSFQVEAPPLYEFTHKYDPHKPSSATTTICWWTLDFKHLILLSFVPQQSTQNALCVLSIM